MPLLQKLVLARYSLMAGAILFFLPIVVINLRIATPLLGGLFDLRGFWEAFWVSFLAFLLSFSVLVTYRLFITYGPLRCGTGQEVHPPARKNWVPVLLFVVALILPLPLLMNAYSLAGSSRQMWGFVCGLAAAMTVALVVDFTQRLFNTFQGTDADAAKQLFVPFPYPFSKWAEESEFATKVFESPVFSPVTGFLRGLDPKYLTGFVDRSYDPPSIYPGIVLSLVLLLTYLVLYAVGLYFWVRPFDNALMPVDLGITAMAYFLVLLTLLCWVFSAIAFYFDRFRIPTVILLLLILVFSQGEHTYRVVERVEDLRPSTPNSILSARRSDPYIILVAANGGGIQSAAWTTEVLTRIDEACREVDPDPRGCKNAIALMSGVSGGSVGTMYYFDGYGETADPAAMNEVVRRSASSSSLAYVGGGLVFNDTLRSVPGFNWIFENSMDRGKHLQRGWIRNRRKAECQYMEERGLDCEEQGPFVPTHLNQTMSNWGHNIADNRRPAVIFNATMVESGKRLLFSSARFEDRPKETDDWLTMNHLFGDSRDIDVVEAVRLSASFPFVTPAAATPGGVGPQNEHVVDGGYFDNYGLMSVRDFLRDALKVNPFDARRRPKVIIIQIYGDEVVRDVKGDPDPEKSRRINRERLGFLSWYRQVFAPLNTLLNVRQTSQYTRNLEAFHEIEGLLKDSADVSHFVFKFSKKKEDATAAQIPSTDGTKENVTPVERGGEDYDTAPLSWHLTEREQKAITQVSCEMRSGCALNENTTNWKRLMELIRNPASTTDWTRCSSAQ